MSGSGSRPCPVCESVGPREVLYRQRFVDGPLGDGYDVVVCNECGAGFADGIPSQAELDRYYAERSKYTYSHAGGAESPYDFRRFEQIADQLELYLPSKQARILDIGCATGGLLAVLQKRGYQNLKGSDPSPACASAAGALYGVNVKVATLAEHRGWTERYDAVLLVGVLEHVRDVRAAVEIAAELLEIGGVFYCAQPDVQKFAECDNAPFQQFSTEHLNFFSDVSLTNLMVAANFAPLRLWQWMVEWRKGMTDSVVSGVFVRGSGRKLADRITREALTRYVQAARTQEQVVLERIDTLVRSQTPVLLWGTGTATRRLIATTSLGCANIVAFIDSQVHGTERIFIGRPVLAPSELVGRTEMIVICSHAFDAEIRQSIQSDLRLSNPIVSLFVSAPSAK